MTRLVNTVRIERAPEDVFDYVTAPARWPEWHPSSAGVEVETDGSLPVGGEVREAIHVGGTRDQVVWTVREHDRPRKWVIDGRGGLGGTATITYRLTPDGGGTAFERELVYRMPNALLGVLNVLVIQWRMRAASKKALANLKRVLESG